MSDQNSVIEHQIRPSDLIAELGIQKDAYYAYLKYLNLRAEKDSEGKAYLSEEQANAIRLLRSHVKETGKMEGFLDRNGQLAIAQEASLDGAQPETQAQTNPMGDQLDELIRAAAELKGQQLVMPQMVINELASRMTYEDLPEDVRAKVDQVRESASPKYQPAHLADQLLTQWRSRATATAAA